MGETDTDTVFLRAFSALILAVIIDYDQGGTYGNFKRVPFLNIKLFQDWFYHSCEYYRKEKDVRGFISDKGWAHSIAHGADLFRTFAQHRYLNQEMLIELLSCLAHKISEPLSMPYTYLEDKRIAAAVYTAFLRTELTFQQVQNFFTQITTPYFKERWFFY